MEALIGRTYPTLEAARKAIDDLARSLGYTFVIHRSSPNSKTPNRVVLRCGRGRSPTAHPYSNTATPPEKRRKGNSKMTNCPCRIGVKLHKPLGNIPQPTYWYIDGPGPEINLTHNHDPARGLGEFSRLRREALESRRCYVLALSAAGVSQANIVGVLRQDVDEAVRTVTTHDVSNLIRKVKLEEEHTKAMAARGLNDDGTPLVSPQVPEPATLGGQAGGLRQPHDQGDGSGQQHREGGDTDRNGAVESNENEEEPRGEDGQSAADDNEQDETSIQHQLLAT